MLTVYSLSHKLHVFHQIICRLRLQSSMPISIIRILPGHIMPAESLNLSPAQLLAWRPSTRIR